LKLDDNLDRFAGTDVGDVDAKHVRAILGEQRSLLAARLCAFVCPSGFNALLDLSFDDSGADDHMQAVDGGGLRQREDVDRFHPLLYRVEELLRDLGSQDDAGDADVGVGVHGGGRVKCLLFVGEEQAGTVGCLRSVRRGAGDECAQQ
jgi:hypothetical protein